jgi:hypothetical protein
MGSKSYYEGRDMEKNNILHSLLIQQFNFDSVESDGSNTTKGDIIAIKSNEKIPLSVKNVSGKNTQVHLTTIKKLSSDLNMPDEVKSPLVVWLGSNDDIEFNFWSKDIILTNYEKNHNRLSSHNIQNWNQVEKWFNENTKNKIIPKLLIESLKNDNKSKILLWINKISKKIDMIDIPKLIDYIGDECRWVTMPKGTVLKCLTPQGKPILWLQMKGNRTDDGYNHAPQFHIVENWPDETIIHKAILQ